MSNNIDILTHDTPTQPGCGPLLHGDPSVQMPLRQRIFEHVRAAGQVARSDISRALDISPGSVTTLTAEMIAMDLLREVEGEPRETGRGRPRVALEVVPDAAYVVGIKLGFRQHFAVLSDFAGNICATATLPYLPHSGTVADLIDKVATLMNLLVAQSGIDRSRLCAIAVGLPGIVDYESGTITWSSLLKGQEQGQDMAAAFTAQHGLPMFLDNDTNMLTLGELWFGAGRAKTDFAVVSIENGVGMGLVVDNRLYRGTHGMGLELGHTKVQMDGALCRCGQRGCLEAYLADYALSREASTALDQTMGTIDQEKQLAHLLERAKAGHSAAQTIFRRAGRYLSVGLANVVQLFDPPLIILTGERERNDYLFSEEVMRDIQGLTLSTGRQPCEIQVHAWDDMVWARGATVPALDAMTRRIVAAGLG